jgi:hypothetical protein
MLLPLPTPLAPVPSLRTAKYNTIPFGQIDLCVSCAIFLRHSLLNRKQTSSCFRNGTWNLSKHSEWCAFDTVPRCNYSEWSVQLKTVCPSAQAL